ncbi:MAG TPA: hypothetical protein VGI99_00770 [Gemmataceae bacterium]
MERSGQADRHRKVAVFLVLEQYSAAERCFDRVAKEFPDSYEGWANLGYACLMQYCDKLDEKDLREFDIGPIGKRS